MWSTAEISHNKLIKNTFEISDITAVKKKKKLRACVLRALPGLKAAVTSSVWHCSLSYGVSQTLSFLLHLEGLPILQLHKWHLMADTVLKTKEQQRARCSWGRGIGSCFGCRDSLTGERRGLQRSWPLLEGSSGGCGPLRLQRCGTAQLGLQQQQAAMTSSIKEGLTRPGMPGSPVSS